jgi:hypothetical protein
VSTVGAGRGEVGCGTGLGRLGREKESRPGYRVMGRGAGPMREGETRRGKKSQLATGNWAQRAKGI